MQTRPDQPPEGKLIAAAADRMNLSIREAAKRAGISYGRWRQIVTGYQNVSPGSFAEVHAPAKTLAKMARTVGVTPDAMETEGQRPDAAEIMRETERSTPAVLDFPGIEQLARELGVDPDDDLNDPYLGPVIQEISDARDIHGDRPTGSQVFYGRPASSIEAGIWDDARLSPRSKVLLIAGMRADRERHDDGRRARSTRHGTAGLALRVIAGGP